MVEIAFVTNKTPISNPRQTKYQCPFFLISIGLSFVFMKYIYYLWKYYFSNSFIGPYVSKINLDKWGHFHINNLKTVGVIYEIKTLQFLSNILQIFVSTIFEMRLYCAYGRQIHLGHIKTFFIYICTYVNIS